VLVVEEKERRLDWWTMYFDGAINIYSNGDGTIIISPD
jgi:hypothetical protein